MRKQARILQSNMDCHSDGDEERRIDTSHENGNGEASEIWRKKESSQVMGSRSIRDYLAAVLEYCGAEVLETSGEAAQDNKRKTIKPRYLMLGNTPR